MQKDIGAVMGLYPMPTTVVGTVLEGGRVNFLPIAHVGIVEHGHFLISVDQSHRLDDAAIQKNGVVSVSLINRDMMKAADWCGIVKAENVDKSDAFPWHFDDLGKAPVIENAPVCMTCRVERMFTVGAFHDFILKPVHTYVQEEDLNERGKIDYEKVGPVLFEFQSAQYLSTGNVIAKCWDYGKDYKK
jgi:flavin reductase (DIM6/NTAB) family NADH-FMN oxidoreductase RutF